MANWLEMRTSAMGTAIVGGSQAYVVFERVERFAKTKTDWGHDITTTLGLTIAHEIGHLLLRTSTHTVTGLMGAAWGPADAQLAASGRLLFTSREAALIRKGLTPYSFRPAAQLCMTVIGAGVSSAAATLMRKRPSAETL